MVETSGDGRTARGRRTERLCDHLASLPERPPVEMPNNEAFQQMLASMKTGGPPD